MSLQAQLVCLFTLAVGLLLPGYAGSTPTRVAPPVKGQAQMMGGNATFGATYTLKNSFNFVIYSAHYSMEPLSCYMDGTAPTMEEKLLVFDIGVKNAAPVDNAINTEHMFTVVDSTGQLYTYFDVVQDSLGRKGFNGMRRPGQGFGQPELKDGLHVAMRLPAKARIVKIMINTGRKFAKPDEEVFRYYIAGATKAEAGADGDPKNVIAPLPADLADPSDKSGAIPLDEGKGVIGQELPSGKFHIKLNSVTSTTDPITGSAPAADKKFVVFNVTAKLMVDATSNNGYVEGYDRPAWQIVDSDGERYKPDSYIKASSKENADHNYEKGDEYTFRLVFVVPKAAMFKKLVIGARDGRKYAFDGSVIQ